MLQISSKVVIPEDEIEMSAIRSRGPGGQNVNKVATAIQLRFDIGSSSLPDTYKERLLSMNDQRISSEGVIVIKAQQYRSQEKNREDAMGRLQLLVRSAGVTRKKRRATKPSRNAVRKRLEQKEKRGKIKRLRDRVSNHE